MFKNWLCGQHPRLPQVHDLLFFLAGAGLSDICALQRTGEGNGALSS